MKIEKRDKYEDTESLWLAFQRMYEAISRSPNPRETFAVANGDLFKIAEHARRTAGYETLEIINRILQGVGK